MKWLFTFLLSSIGRKAIMAVTGMSLVGFVVGHLAGNLQIFLGPEKLNAYAAFLKSMPGPLWGARLGLLGCVGLHFATALSLYLENRAARPIGYHSQKFIRTTYAARTMIWGGPIVALFVAYHLLHLTVGVAGPASFDHIDVYANVVRGFRVPAIAGFYILAMAALGLHLYHGIWSMLQSLGVNHARFNPLFHAASILTAIAVFVGNTSIPVAVLTGLIGGSVQ